MTANSCSFSDTISQEIVCSAFQTFLSTNDAYVRKSVNDWIVNKFRPHQHAWEILPALIWGTEIDLQNQCKSEISLLACQILYQKLYDDFNQILPYPDKCLQLYNFLSCWCFQIDFSNHQFCSNSIRYRMAECLGLASITFYGTSLKDPLSDMMTIINIGLDSSKPNFLVDRCFQVINMVHALGVLPDFISTIETRSGLLSFMGYKSYIHWRKTSLGLYAQEKVPFVNECLKKSFDFALSSLQSALCNKNTELVTHCHTLVENLCTAAIRWIRVFNRVLLFSNVHSSCDNVLWKVFSSDSYFTRLSVVPELLCTLITASSIPDSLIRVDNNHNNKMHARTYETPLTLNDFGELLHLFSLIFVTFQTVVAPSFSFVSIQNGNIPTLQEIETHGGTQLSNFAYRWALVTYHILVAIPSLITHQTEPLSINMNNNNPCVCTLPPHFFVQMFNLFSYFLPQTHLKMMDLWLDVSDLSNDQSLCNRSVENILSQMSHVSLRCMIAHGHRDNLIWKDSGMYEFQQDSESRQAYIDTCLDVSVVLYYLYQRIDAQYSFLFLLDMEKTFNHFVAIHNTGATAFVLLLLSSIFETLVDPIDTRILDLLERIVKNLSAEEECILVLTNIAKKLSVYMVEDYYKNLWMTLIDALIRFFPINPSLCAQAIHSLCDAGGSLPLHTTQDSLQHIRSFYEFIQLHQSTFDEQNFTFVPILYGSIVCLIRRCSRDKAEELFSHVLASTTANIENRLEQLNKKNEKQSLMSLLISLKSVVQAFMVLPITSSEQPYKASRSDVFTNNKEKNDNFFALHHLFQNNNSLDVINVYFTASKYLMDTHISVDEESCQIVPCKDCYQKKYTDKFLRTSVITPEMIRNLAFHLIRLIGQLVPINDYPQFWTFLLKTYTEHSFKRAGLDQVDGSMAFIFSDTAVKILDFKKEFNICEKQNEEACNTVNNAFHLWVSSMNSILVPLMTMLCEKTKTTYWCRILFPFFKLMQNTLTLLKLDSSWNYIQLEPMIPILIQSLCCPHTKLHHCSLESLCILLNNSHPTCLGLATKFYNTMVQSFWLYCHFWDLSRISPCVSFLNSLLTSTFDTSRTDNFVVSSRSIWNQREFYPDDVGKLFLKLNQHDMDFLLQLFEIARGVRLRQVLMDIIKIAQGLAGSDCLLSYQFLLKARTKNQEKTIVVD